MSVNTSSQYKIKKNRKIKKIKKIILIEKSWWIQNYSEFLKIKNLCENKKKNYLLIIIEITIRNILY